MNQCPDVTRAKELIKSFEKCRLTAYLDKPKNGVWTCGWGSTGPDIKKGTVWTQAEADRRFDEHFNKMVNQLMTSIKGPCTPDEFNAVCSLVYNIGMTAFLNSSLLRKINNFTQTESVAKEFLRWDYDDGKKEPGLTRRRLAEHNLFLGKPYELG
jgi:lysozyme